VKSVHADGFIIDDESWERRLHESRPATGCGKTCARFPRLDRSSQWTVRRSTAGLYRDAIENAPEYLLSSPITREYENRLYFHTDARVLDRPEDEASLSLLAF